MKKRRKILLKISATLSFVLITAIVFTAALLEPKIRIYGWETLDENKLIKNEKTFVLYDKDNNIMENTLNEINDETVELDLIPSHTIDAFTSIEDKRFYKHHGVDYVRIAGAVLNNIKYMAFKEGASTISQQLIKNTHLTSDKTIGRKLKEIRIARELERKYSKDEILEMYLNMLYFGNNIYGIKSAAKMFFNCTPNELTLSQSAVLAGIINNPAKYNPCINPENSKKRRNTVLSAMLKNGKISETEYLNASNEDLKINTANRNLNQYINSIIKDACKALGISKSELYSKRLNIYTYYNNRISDEIKNILRTYNFPDDVDCHVTVLDNANGILLSDTNLKDVNLSDYRRQPGSTIKPLICYAPALEKGNIYCCSPIEDSPTVFDNYKPSNFKNKYYGWVTQKDALAHSLNMPAVKLLESNGIEYSKSLCARMGLTFDAKDNNLALALGGMTYGVTLRELTDAYRTFPAMGKYTEGSTIRKITDENGNILFSDNRHDINVIGSDTAFLVTTMLRNCVEIGTAKKLNKYSNVCAKTGTVGNSKGNTDVYCMAYSPNFTVGIHIGSYEKKLPDYITSSNQACQVAYSVFAALNDTSIFKQPDNVKCRYIDVSKLQEEHIVMLAGDDIPLKDKSCEWFSERNLPSEFSTPQYSDYWDYNDILNLDFDNFKIIDSFFD